MDRRVFGIGALITFALSSVVKAKSLIIPEEKIAVNKTYYVIKNYIDYKYRFMPPIYGFPNEQEMMLINQNKLDYILVENGVIIKATIINNGSFYNGS